MGHKKRNVALRSKAAGKTAGNPPPPPPALQNGDGDVGVVSSVTTENGSINLSVVQVLQRNLKNEEVESDGYSAVKVECEKALTALRRGNHTKALRLMKEMCSKYENSAHLALIHRVQGTVCVKVASIIDDPNPKQRHLKNAIESAKKAVMLSPNSIEFAHFYANLLYEAANEQKDYDEVIQEVERGLAIENPVDPGKESLQDESQQKISGADARIGHVQNELRSLLQKSNIASLSSWMKTIGNGEEKFRLIPLRRVPDDPMDVRLVQARRPNEIKKASKTDEERKKEIEVKVAAARLLQQKLESSQSQSDGDKGSESSTSGQRAGERRRSSKVKKNASSAERKDYVRPYWKSMALEMKKDLLKIRISDFEAHFRSPKAGLAYEVISDALSFAAANNSWKFWMCCRCNEKFADPDLHMQHVIHEHLGSLLPKLQAVMPINVENEWIEMLLNCHWKALDVHAAIRMVEAHSYSQSTNSVDIPCAKTDSESPNDCFTESYCSDDAWDSSIGLKKYGYSCNGLNSESREYAKLQDDAPAEREQVQGYKGYFPPDSWPLACDIERRRLLDKIQSLFQLLIKHKYLAASHLNKVIQFAVEELNSQLLNCGVGQSPICICFLGAPELTKVLKFLQELSHSCGLGRYSEKGNLVEDLSSSTQPIEMTERIAFDEDGSCLLFDERFLPCKLSETTCQDTPAVDATAVANFGSDSVSASDDDSLLSWIFSGPTSGEQLTFWTGTKEEKLHQGLQILQMLEKEFYHLQSLCERKLEHMCYEEALQLVEDVCLEEGKKRENATEVVRRSYESVLRKRQEELVERGNDLTFTVNRFEVDALTNVLKEADALNVNQFGFEESYGGLNSHLCDLESGEDDDWRMKDYLHQVDSCIEVAIQKQKEQLSIELSKIDARIMRNLTGMQQLEAKLDSASAHDFGVIVVPLVKSFLRARLEDLAEKDATEKSDAAREAFLAELAFDSKKGNRDNAKHANDKLKDKRKSKEHRKTKEYKATGNSELRVSNENEEKSFSPPGIDGQQQEPETRAEIGDAFDPQEDELRRRNIEFEAEERKLQETLEYQRRIENEAKQKHLAEQHRNNSRAIHERMVDIGSSDGHVKYNIDNDVDDHFKPFRQEPLKRNDGLLNKPEDVPGNAKDGGSGRAGLLNGGAVDDSDFIPDKRIARKGRRHKNMAKIDGKQQPVSSETENSEVGQLTHKDILQGDSYNSYSGENGTKVFRQLQAEDVDEERFQADLKTAVLQSLDSFHAHKKYPLTAGSVVPENVLVEGEDSCVTSVEVTHDNFKGSEVYGTGLKNEVGQYNCFLNVIIQSLWHLRRFRDEFLRRSTSPHLHVGDPCVTCALYDIFIALSMASTDTRGEAVSPTRLRIALSNLYPKSNFFQEAQMNDASEVLGVVFECLHQSFISGSCVSDIEPVDSTVRSRWECVDISGSCVSDIEPVDSTVRGLWECVDSACIAHTLFGMDIFERMNCSNCGLESRRMKYTSFFHQTNANSLRTMKVIYPKCSFDELLNFVDMDEQLPCDPEAGGCGELNHIHHILSTAPHVFTTVLGWQNTCESVEDIKSTLAALATEIDMSVLYRGLDPNSRRCLVSVVCYYGQHYYCFAYRHDHERWVLYDDKTVQVIGGWEDVLTKCEKGHLQPQVLFYEAVN